MKLFFVFLLFVVSLTQTIFAANVVCKQADTTYRTECIPESGDFTAMLFINVAGYTDRNKKEWPNGMVISCGSGYYDGWRLILLDENNFVPLFEIGRPDIGAISLRANYGLSKNSIHHLTIVWDESDNGLGIMRIYIDGILVGERKDVDVKPIITQQKLLVGYNDFGVGELDAKMYGVAYYNKALTNNEIYKSFQEGLKTNLTDDSDFNQRFYKGIYSRQSTPKPEDSIAIINELRENKFNFEDKNKKLNFSNETNFFGRYIERSSQKDSEKIVFQLSESTAKNEDLFRSEFFGLVDKIKQMRSNGNITPVEIQFNNAFYLYGQSLVIENLTDVIFSHCGFYGQEEHSVSIAAKENPERFRQNKKLDFYSLSFNSPYSFVPYNCSTSHGEGFMCWKKDNNNIKPLFLSMFPESGFIDGKSNGVEIELEDKDVEKIKQEPYLLAHGYWKYFWADAATKVSVSKNKLSFTFEDSSIPYGLGEKPRYRFLNVFSELDKDSEYCIDENKLYFTGSVSHSTKICFTKKNSPFLIIRNCKNITIRNFKFEGTTKPAVEIDNVDGLTIKDSLFENIGSSALLLNKVKNADISNCVFKNIGSCGIRIWAGNREKLESPNVIIRNSKFTNTGSLVKTYTPSIFMDGYGIVVQNCDFLYTPSSALRIEGSAHVVEGCRFAYNVLESDDQGVIDMWGDPTYRGCVFRYNVFGELGAGTNKECGRAAIRFDDMISGMYVYGNIFNGTSEGNFGAVQIHGGSHNLIFNNQFHNCKYGISFTPRGKEIFDSKKDELEPKLKNYVSNDLYLEAYPSFLRTYEDYDTNFIFGNRFIKCGMPFREKKASIYFYGNGVKQ